MPELVSPPPYGRRTKLGEESKKWSTPEIIGFVCIEKSL